MSNVPSRSFSRYVRILNVSSIQISTDQTTGQLKYDVKADAYFIQ